MDFKTMREAQLAAAAKMLEHGPTRRQFLKYCAAAGLAPTLLGMVRPADAAASEIVVANWGGDTSKQHERIFGQPYTEKTGIPVVFDSSPLEGKIKAMVESKKTIWDVMDIDAFSAIKLGKQGYLRPIDYSVVNRDTIEGTSFEHGAAAYVMSYVLAYDKSKFPDGEPKSWADFWDVEKFPGKRVLYKWVNGALEAALMADGVPRESLYPLDIPRALNKIAEIKDHLLFWDSGAESQQLLRNGDVVMGCIWSSRAYLLEQETQGRITFHWNEGIAYGDTWSVPVDNPAGDDVWAFIAFMQEVDRQLELLTALTAGPVTAAAAEATPDELRRINPVYPDNWKLQVLQDANWWSEHYDEALAAYTDAIAG